jgi:cell fate (sporulation/competence/biofilm development) regulator YlbF (YheA/YmcA/DUF963 family)
MDWTELMTLAMDASDEWKQSEAYQTYIDAKKELSDPSLVPLIDSFDKTKKTYEEVIRYGKYHPDFEAATNAFIEAKTALYQTSQYQAYSQALYKINEQFRLFTSELNEVLLSCKVMGDQPKSCHTKGR